MHITGKMSPSMLELTITHDRTIMKYKSMKFKEKVEVKGRIYGENLPRRIKNI